LFSGIGGIELGFERAGFETEWFVENEPYAQRILRKHWPKAKIYDDVTQVDWRTVPEVDILTGGFPCQDISNAGKRAGITGRRSSLWTYYLEAISILRPGYVLIENVAALTHRGLDTVLCDLASVGYDAEWYCVPASAIGAPHQRDRIFILAYPQCDGRIRFRHQMEKGCHPDQINAPESKSSDVSDCYSERFKKQCIEESTYQRKWREKFECHNWWKTEPGMDRMVDGVPNRVDRIRCLGNAVVPQVAEVFAKAIREKL
jgi:DNA (cytosine-5)-methyltransferase 1